MVYYIVSNVQQECANMGTRIEINKAIPPDT